MQIEKYKTESTVDNLIYTFESVGEKVIQKMVEYSKLNPVYIGLSDDDNVYNLAFGDWDDEINDYVDNVESKNGDMEKVLATVANTTLKFWEEYPEAQIFFQGSLIAGENPRRTRLYQMKLNRYFNDISETVTIKGYRENEWEDFENNKNYMAFLISPKKQLF
ncbi:MAG: hypothetical protein RLZZ306_1293 [Bacteroidota bacterium]|jgi:hypothetical protein